MASSSAWEQITAKQSITFFIFYTPLPSFHVLCMLNTRVSQQTLSKCLQQRCWWSNRRLLEDLPCPGQGLLASSSSTLAPGNVPVLGSFTCLVISCRAGVGKQSSAPSRLVPASHSRLQHAACAQGWSRRYSEPAAPWLTLLLLLGSTE